MQSKTFPKPNQLLIGQRRPRQVERTELVTFDKVKQMVEVLALAQVDLRQLQSPQRNRLADSGH